MSENGGMSTNGEKLHALEMATEYILRLEAANRRLIETIDRQLNLILRLSDKLCDQVEEEPSRRRTL